MYMYVYVCMCVCMYVCVCVYVCVNKLTQKGRSIGLVYIIIHNSIHTVYITLTYSMCSLHAMLCDTA